MIKGVFESVSDWGKLFFLVVFALLGVLAFSLLGYLAVLIVYGFEALSWVTSMNINATSVGALKILQVSQTVGMFIFPGFFLAYLYSKQPKSYLGFNSVDSKNILLVVVTMLISLPGINLLASLNEQIPLSDWMIRMETSAEMLTKAFMGTDGFAAFFLNLIMVAVLPAIGEELVFRGIIQKHLSNLTRSSFVGIMLTALLFSAFHLQFKGFVPRFALGVMFGYMYVWSGSIWLPMVAHFTNNCIATVGYMLIDTGNVSQTIEDVGGLTYLWPIGIISIAGVLLLLVQIRSKSKIELEH
ncbi:MAG: lysostaphin resistance A-like protein [Bacteroidales bacterium]